jgi:hypothetical protein
MIGVVLLGVLFEFGRRRSQTLESHTDVLDGPRRREAALALGQGDQAASLSVASSKNVRALE